LDLDDIVKKTLFLQKILENKESFSNAVRMRVYFRQLIYLAMDKPLESIESSEDEDS
jgi:hypothetical protein